MSDNIGSSIINLINTIRIGDTADMSRVNNSRYEQDQRAQHIKDTYGIKVPNFYEFNRQFPSDEKPAGVASRIGKWMITGAIASAVVLGGMALLGGIGSLASALIPAAVITLGFGVIGGLVDDEKPQIDLRQMKRFETYLDSIEKDIAKAKEQGILTEVGQDQAVAADKAKSPKSFVELVNESRAAAAQAPTTGRA